MLVWVGVQVCLCVGVGVLLWVCWFGCVSKHRQSRRGHCICCCCIINLERLLSRTFFFSYLNRSPTVDLYSGKMDASNDRKKGNKKMMTKMVEAKKGRDNKGSN